MKNNIKKLIYGILLSVLSLGVGFFALAVPFQLFNELSNFGIKLLFVCEIVAYIIIGLVFLVVKDKNNQKRAKKRKKQLERKEKVKKMQEEWLNLAA